jgi:soluble lytic murein transglycosylase-like protein
MSHRFTAMACLAISLLSGPVAAQGLCTWEGAASRYGVNPQVLYAIAAQESNLNPNAVHENEDGSQDLGLTQINSKWLPQLSKLGVTAANLMNPCVNMHVGAYLLSLKMIRHGNTWQAIGSYHSNTPWRRDRYAQTIYQRVQSQNTAPATKGG